NTTGQSMRQYICKLMPDGKFDTNFGINGYFFFSNGNSTSFNSLAEGPNGILYICGTVDVNSYKVATLWKVDANGIPSATFGSGNGKGSLNLGAKSDQLFFDLEVLDKGDIFLVGVYRFDGGALQPVTAVFKDDGSLNTDYHGAGFDTLNMAPDYGTMYFENVAKDADGNMVVTGIATDQSFDSYQVTARFKKQAPPVSSVKNVADASYSVKVYPNPSAGTFSVKTDGGYKVKAVNISDISGKQVAGWHNAQDSYTVPAHIPNGLYYISISFEGGVENRKLILNR
ncbi:MAG TPA: T9SS type A sorting domain-containing protein, partial [Flavipsychrobacter sp.]